MFPVITKIGPFTLHTFGVMLALAILVGSAVLARENRRLGDPAITDELLQKLIWYVVIAVVAGGRLMHVIVEWSYFSKHPLEIVAIWKGGLVMYGGLIATFVTVVGFAIKHKINVLRLCDLIAPSAFLGDAIGRWGCFFAGDDYGRPTDSWVGVRFTDPECLVPPHLRGVPLHPTQIYMSIKALTIAGILFWITRHKKFDGQVAGWSLMLYAVFRSIVEFFRGDEDRGAVFHFDFTLFGYPVSWGSTAQFTSIFVFATGLLILLLAPKKTLADDLAAAEKPTAADEPAPRKSKKKRKKKAAG